MKRQIIDYYGTRSSIGQGPYLPRGISSSMRRQLIDYYGTRWGKSPISQEELFVHEATNYRLLRYSMGQAPYFPRGFSRPRGNKSSTTSVLDLRRDMFPISQEDYPIHEAIIYRLLQYSIFGWDKLSISKEEFLHL